MKLLKILIREQISYFLYHLIKSSLLYKLKYDDISGSLLEWFSDYLSDRKQRVINEGFKSTWERTRAGVPQGSVLGPCLFLPYINDIVNNIKTNIRLFADDTSLFVVIENEVNELLNEDLVTIGNWADD